MLKSTFQPHRGGENEIRLQDSFHSVHIFMGAAESIEEQTGVVRFGDNENVWQDQETTSGGQERSFDDLITEAKGNASLL